MIREDCYWHSEEPDMGARLHFCSRQKGSAPLETCDGCENYHSRYKRTNGNLIRAMSDKELAEYMSQVETDGRCGIMKGRNGWLDWLKQEAPL